MVTVFKPVIGGGVTVDKAWNWTINSTYKEQGIFTGQIVNVWTYEVGSYIDPPFTVPCLLTQTIYSCLQS